MNEVLIDKSMQKIDLPDEDAAGCANEATSAEKTVDVEKQKTFSQADVDRIVKERLEREKSSRERSAVKAKEQAEAEALKNNQEWQTLAQMQEQKALDLQAKLGELEPLGQQLSLYKGALEKTLASEKKELPKHVLVLLEKLDPLEQIDYLTANREELGKSGRAESIPASPSPRARTLSEDEQAAARRGQANLYSNF